MEEKRMIRCFDLAAKGLGHVAPNPMVGAVIVHNGRIIGEGYHRKYGEAHAEVNAIASVSDRRLLKESTLYVNLEPCSHYGKTPPCAKLIIESQIPEVVIANNDPFPEVSGRGIKMLREAGVKVTEGFLAEKGWELNRRFFTFHTQNRPFVTLKWAQTANGFMDVERTNPQTPPLRISSNITSMFVHKLRSEESAILVGTKTTLLDNPELTVRNWRGENPIRILIDRNLTVPDSFRIFNEKSRTIVFTEKQPENKSGVNIEYVEVAFDQNGKHISISNLLKELYVRNIQSLLVEGGRELLNSFIQSDLWDEMRVETALKLSIPKGVPAPFISGRCVQTEIIGNHLIERFTRI